MPDTSPQKSARPPANALNQVRWLFACLQSEPTLAALLSPWQVAAGSLFEAPAAQVRPDPQTLELAIWLAGFADFPADLLKLITEASGDRVEVERIRAEAATALARDPEPPRDWLRRALRHLSHWLAHGATPFAGYYSLRRLHFLTRGRSSRIQALLAQALKPAPNLACPPSLLGDLTDAAPQAISAVAQDSVTVLPRRLSAGLIDEITEFARSTPCYPSLANVEHRDQISGEYTLPKLLFDPAAPLAHRYDFHFGEIWTCPAIQRIAADPLWPWLAEQYLGAEVGLTMAYLWWSAAFDGPQSRYTGQVFHIDVDRFHFVNFFFYLSDVDGAHGPQVYVTGSHAEMPLELALDQRWSDAELQRVYPEQRFREIHAPAGSVILANTLAYHKGKTLQTGTRLMFQLEFASATLGENTPLIPRPERIEPELAAALREHPKRYPKLAHWLA